MRGARRLVLLTLFLTALASRAWSQAPLTLILGAFDAEVAAVEAKLQDPKPQTIQGVRFVVGRLGMRNVALAQTGMGKVNAAMTSSIALMAFKPEQVVFSGIAGGLSPELQPGDLVIGERIVQHDYGFLGPKGFRVEATQRFDSKESNPLFYASDPSLVALAERIAQKLTFASIPSKKKAHAPKVRKGIIATGDAFIASSAKKKELIESFKADAVEMEGAAIAQVCLSQRTPFLIIRSISDSADETAETDVKAFYQTAAENSARFVATLVTALDK